MKLTLLKIFAGFGILSISACSFNNQNNKLIVPDGANRVAINGQIKQQDVDRKGLIIAPAKNLPIVSEVKAESSKENIWLADAKKSLRENIVEWTQSSGWPEPEWLTKKEFYIGRTTYLHGSFPEVLEQITKESFINICITHKPRTIRITDFNVSCKFSPVSRTGHGEFNVIQQPPLLILEKTLTLSSEINIPVKYVGETK